MKKSMIEKIKSMNILDGFDNDIFNQIHDVNSYGQLLGLIWSLVLFAFIMVVLSIQYGLSLWSPMTPHATNTISSCTLLSSGAYTIGAILLTGIITCVILHLFTKIINVSTHKIIVGLIETIVLIILLVLFIMECF